MIKFLGQLIGMLIGSSLSPSWILMPMVLQDYFDMKHAMTGVGAFFAEYQRFQAIAEIMPQHILYNLTPKLMLVLLLGGSFVCACSWLFGQLALQIEHRVKANLAS